MVIYPPNNSRATYDKPQWATQDTTKHQPAQFEAFDPAEAYIYQTGEMDNNTLENTPEISDSVIEAKVDNTQVKFIKADTEFMYTWRGVVRSQ